MLVAYDLEVLVQFEAKHWTNKINESYAFLLLIFKTYIIVFIRHVISNIFDFKLILTHLNHIILITNFLHSNYFDVSNLENIETNWPDALNSKNRK